MAGMKVQIIGKTRFNPSLSGASTTILTLAKELEVGQSREALVSLRVHGTPTITNITSVKLYIWALSGSAEEPGTDYIYRDATTNLVPVALATITLPAASSFSNLPANNGWLGMAPVNINGTTQTGHFGSRLRAVLEIVTSSSPALDVTLSADLDLKA